MSSLLQFSVRGLLVAVTAAAIGLAALLSANGWWEAAAWGAALLALSSAVLFVIYRGQEQRAFWLGFVVFGGMYLFLLLYSFTVDLKDDPDSANPLHYNSLATTKAMALAYESVLPASRRQEHALAPVAGGDVSVSWNSKSDSDLVLGPDGRPVNVGFSDDVSYMALTLDGGTRRVLAAGIAPNPSYIPPGNFISIGHTLWLLMIAAVGGKICQWIYRTRPKT